MDIFNFKTSKKQIEIFERNVAEVLKNNFPEIKKTLKLSSEEYSIFFSKKPSGIYLERDYNTLNEDRNSSKNKTTFNIYGLKVFHKKHNKYEDITLFFNTNLLTFIEVKKPKSFYKTHDFYKLQIGELRTEYVYTENQDTQKTLDILKNVSQDQLNQLEIADAIEIEINHKLYYTILDMKVGNYIAIDNSKKVYRLNHDLTEKVKKISDNIDAFFDLYKGNKSNLMELMSK